MEIKYRKNYDTLTVYINGELDECSSSNVKNILDKLLLENTNAKKVVFNLSGVSFMDSTGIGLLIGRYKKLSSLKIPLYIEDASVASEKVITLAGLYSIMPKY